MTKEQQSEAISILILTDLIQNNLGFDVDSNRIRSRIKDFFMKRFCEKETGGITGEEEKHIEKFYGYPFPAAAGPAEEEEDQDLFKDFDSLVEEAREKELDIHGISTHKVQDDVYGAKPYWICTIKYCECDYSSGHFENDFLSFSSEGFTEQESINNAIKNFREQMLEDKEKEEEKTYINPEVFGNLLDILKEQNPINSVSIWLDLKNTAWVAEIASDDSETGAFRSVLGKGDTINDALAAAAEEYRSHAQLAARREELLKDEKVREALTLLGHEIPEK